MTNWNGASGPPACITASRAEEIDGWLFINSGRDPGSKVVIATQNRDGVTIAVPVVEALVKTIRDNQIDVVMIDPFISSHQVPENDNNAIDAVAKTWTMIADVTNTAIDLAHHTRKTGGAEVTVEDGRGAVALLNAVRPARVLNVMTEDEAIKGGVIDGRRRYFRVTDGKNNLALPADKADWFRSTVGQILATVTRTTRRPRRQHGGRHGVAVAGPARRGDGRGLREGRPPRSGPASGGQQPGQGMGRARRGQGAGAGRRHEEGLDRTKVTGMVNSWITMGALVVVKRQDPVRRKTKDFVEVPPDR